MVSIGERIHTMILDGLASHACLISSQKLGSRSANPPNSKPLEPHLRVLTQALLMLWTTLCAAGFVVAVVTRRASPLPWAHSAAVEVDGQALCIAVTIAGAQRRGSAEGADFRRSC